MISKYLPSHGCPLSFCPNLHCAGNDHDNYQGNLGQASPPIILRKCQRDFLTQLVIEFLLNFHIYEGAKIPLNEKLEIILLTDLASSWCCSQAVTLRIATIIQESNSAEFVLQLFGNSIPRK